MPFRLDEFRAKIQFVTSVKHPALIHKACVKRDMVSNTVYIQHAICEALSRDLDIPLADLLADLPPPKGAAATRFNPVPDRGEAR